MIAALSILGEILENIDEQDNITIFSDNGSQNHKSTKISPFQTPPNSSITVEKIWQPTLLVYSPNLGKKNVNGISKELVSTHDIYSIVLSMQGISETTIKSMQPSPRFFKSTSK